MIKSQIRSLALAKRNTLTQIQIKTWSESICQKLYDSIFFKQAKVIHIYKSFGSEVETQNIINHAFVDDKIVITSEVIQGNVLKHWQVFPDTIYTKDKFGIETPTINCKLFELVNLKYIDLVIVPIVAFDLHNNRIGYGKGFYDRFLKKIDTHKIGLAFDCQKVDDFASDDWDQILDEVITN